MHLNKWHKAKKDIVLQPYPLVSFKRIISNIPIFLELMFKTLKIKRKFMLQQ